MTRQKHTAPHEVFFSLRCGAVAGGAAAPAAAAFPSESVSHLIVRSLIFCCTAFLCILLVCFDPAAVLSVLAATPLL
jgi:hypothetical protein